MSNEIARPPSIHVRAVVTWLAVFPAITVLSYLINPLIPGAPLVVRTLLLTVIVVPVAVYVLVPWALRLRAAVLARRGARQSR